MSVKIFTGHWRKYFKYVPINKALSLIRSSESINVGGSSSPQSWDRLITVDSS